MVITTTAISFICLSLGLAVCAWRFSKAFGVGGNSPGERKIGLLISSYFFSSAFQNGVLGFGTLLFAANPRGLSIAVTVGTLFLVFVAIFGIYVTHYLFWPGRSYLPLAIFTGVVGMAGFILSLVLHFQPILTPDHGIDWNAPWSISLVIFYLLFISIGSFFYIFARLLFRTKSRGMKIFSFLIAGSAVVGIIDAFIRFVLWSGQSGGIDARTYFYDMGIGIIAAIFALVFLFFPISRKTSDRAERKEL